ncbi:hypothetical protein TU85_25700 [Pseudomonas helleri]|nr:hypothetical protein TU85_25700 [Pseudomonas helleri]
MQPKSCQVGLGKRGMLEQQRTVTTLLPDDQIMWLVARRMVGHLAHARHVMTFHASHLHRLAFAVGKADPLTDQRTSEDHQHGKQT